MRRRLREFSVAGAVTALLIVMGLSFLGPVGWPSSPTEIPVYDPDAAGGTGIANELFDRLAITVILVAILLGAAMIGGVYLAKMDEPGKVGP